MRYIDATALREDLLVRIVATRFMPGRVKGRRALERAAGRGDIVALARLEVLLGLADKNAVTAAYEAVADTWLNAILAQRLSPYAQPYTVEKLQRLAKTPYGKRLPLIVGIVARREWDAPRHVVPPEVIEAVERKQRKRQVLKEEPGPEEPTIVRFLQKKLKSAEWRTNIRTGYLHTRNVKLVPIGEERVASSVSYYLRKPRYRWANAASKHEWYVSHAMLSPETRELQKQNRKRVYLTPEKRVRGGRGSALVVEVLDKTRKRPRWIVQG